LEFFPERNELIYVDGGENGPQSLHVLKLGDSAWTTRPLGVRIGIYANFSEYSAKHKVLFFGGGVDNGRTLAVMNAAGTVKATAVPPVGLGVFGSGGRQTIDPISGNLIVFDTGSKYVYSYDPVSDRWTTHGMHPLNNRYGNVMAVATPIPEYGVVFVVKYDYAGSKVYLYKHSAGAGTPLPTDTTPPSPPTSLTVQ
jgi:hypothetical protein